MAPKASDSSVRNRLLRRLPPQDLERLLPRLEPVVFAQKHVLNEPRGTIRHVHFPNAGVVSAVTVMERGSQIEVATIGNEGMVGLSVFQGAQSSPFRTIVQVPGEGLRMKVDEFKKEAQSGGVLFDVVALYQTAFLVQVSQAVACNGLHPIQQRCCRWLLMTQDRAGADEFNLTQEFLSHMLGVRRASVTEVLRPLQEAGYISNRRGNVQVLNRKGLEKACCECYQSVRGEFERLFGKDGAD